MKPVTTHLNAQWRETPLLFETAEYMAEENSAAFWSFVDQTTALNHNEYLAGTDKEKFEEVLNIAGRILTPQQMNILKISLSLRIYSPKIEMYRQLAVDKGLPSDCRAVASVNGEMLCSVDAMKKAIEAASSGSKAEVYKIDHHFPGGEGSKVNVILYADIATSEFRSFHLALKPLAESGTVDYVLRFYRKKQESRNVRLSGYGVELQIKSTEYKAQDDTKITEEGSKSKQDEEVEQEAEIEGFIFSKLESLNPELETELSQLKSHFLESRHELAPMKVWQLQHLSMQTAQRIMSAPEEEQLQQLAHLAQNFPVLARSLVRTKVDDKMKREILKNQAILSSQFDINPSDAALFVNGMQFDLDYVDMYTLLDHIRTEQRVMEGLHKLGVDSKALNTLLSLDMSESKQEYGIDIKDTSILWINDIENDKAYRKWSTSTSELLRPTYPGMLRSIRKNFHNLVIIADPTKSTTGDIIRLVEGFVTHNAPVRIGFVMEVSSDQMLRGLDDAGVAMICAFNYVAQGRGGEEDANYKALQFFIDLYSNVDGDITVEDVTSAFKKKYKSEDLEDVFGEDSDYDVGRMLANEYIEKTGMKKFPQALMNGVPLPEKNLNAEEFEEVVLMEVMKNTQTLQRAVYKGELEDKHDMIDWLMALPNIMPRLNERILSTKTSTYIDMTGGLIQNTKEVTMDEFTSLSAAQMTSVIANSCHYIAAKNNDKVRPLSIWVVADYDTSEGRALLKNAVKYSRESNGVRLCALHNPSSSKDKAGVFSQIVEVAQNTLAPAVARQFLAKVLDDDTAKKILTGSKRVQDFEVVGMDMDAFVSRMESFNEEDINKHAVFASKVLGLTPGKRTIVANGRMIGALEATEKFVDDDFGLLEKYILSMYAEKITQILKDNDSGSSDLSEIIMKVGSVLQTKPQSKTRVNVELKSDQYSVIKLPAKDPSVPAFDIMAICDPVSAAAQKIAPILVVLQEVVNADIKVVLNAREKHSEMPLKSFYRYVLEPSPQFSESGSLTAGPYAKFTGLPESPILTQNYQVPDNWLVEVVQALYDMDNIKLEKVESGVHSEYELEYILLEGHCFEQSSGNPPRGLQFTLGTRSNPVMVDTTVMANLGYFQLKANPGVWMLQLRHGRSSEIYSIASHEGTDSPSGSSEVEVVMSSFRSLVVKVRVAKQPGKQHMELLGDEADEQGGLWNSITSTFGGGSLGSSEEEDEVINIFSVASGHLYERFLRIMMLSVKRNTKSKLKFWFLKSFLSPSLKNSLPRLAEEYGFDFELIQYKWPRWLHQQTEKQRTIWGYKILFLDVLFPLDVKKIIFVDADQIVRADIKELHNLDLEGAPYGFVPFCDSRKEMEGFRFWKNGYWRNHMAGRKYHISALFVVDLKKFRRIAAGDRLRGQYQGLSQDPNSLSNLDQDLPNNMIHQVRIKSLPQDWLWCETWCDDASKATAKTIDLCNNPETKEAKLDAAHRIVAEWTEYDEDIKAVIADIKTNNSEKKHGHTEL